MFGNYLTTDALGMVLDLDICLRGELPHRRLSTARDRPETLTNVMNVFTAEATGPFSSATHKKNLITTANVSRHSVNSVMKAIDQLVPVIDSFNSTARIQSFLSTTVVENVSSLLQYTGRCNDEYSIKIQQITCRIRWIFFSSVSAM